MHHVLHQAWQQVKRRPDLYRLLLPLAQVASQAGATARHFADLALAPVRFGLPWALPAPGIGGSAPAMAGRARLIVMLVVSNLPVDPRVRREAEALAAAGYELLILCPRPAGVAPDLVLDWGPGITIRWLAERDGRFAYRFPCFLGTSLLAAALAERPFAFHAHDLSTTLIALTAARRTGAHAVCDFHEWMSENVTWHAPTSSYRAHAPHVAAVNRWLERLAVRRASATITVAQSIAVELDALGAAGPRVHVVRNIPSFDVKATRSYPSLRQTLAIAPEQTLVLYQGGVGPSRLIEPVIRALAFAPRIVLAVRGPGLEHFSAAYRAIADEAGASARLHLLEAVPSTDVVAAAQGADAGLYTVANLCRSFSLALPNKVFEYMAAGLPVLSADYPEVRRIVHDGGVGVLFDPEAPRSIAAAMMRLAEEPGLGATLRARIPAVLGELGATAEWQRLVAIYDGLALPAGAGARLGPVGRDEVPGRAAPGLTS